MKEVSTMDIIANLQNVHLDAADPMLKDRGGPQLSLSEN
jgi:hypothetical protein